jgi:hypothetical protein
MALSEDQRAMLQLLLEGDQSYADIASLLGADEDEVRSRARDALAEIGDADPDREAGLTDYLLGQADPIGRADAARHLKEDPADHALAEKLLPQLRLIAPEADLPKLPAAPKRSRTGPRREEAKPEPEPKEADAEEAPPPRRARSLPSLPRPRRIPKPTMPTSLSRSQSRLYAALGAGAVLLLVVVLAVAGVFSGSDEAASETTTTAGSDTEVPIRLEPAGGTDARGDAVFGILPEGVFYLDLRLRDLPALPKDKAYVMWFLTSDEAGYPVPVPIEPDASGNFNDRLSLPSETLSVAEQSQFFDISVADIDELTRNIERSVQQDGAQLAYPGGSVLRGELTAGAPLPEGGAALPEGGGALPEGTQLPQGGGGSGK